VILDGSLDVPAKESKEYLEAWHTTGSNALMTSVYIHALAAWCSGHRLRQQN
jgi:cytochrome b561